MNSRTASRGFRVPTSAGEEDLRAGRLEAAEDESLANPTGIAYLLVFVVVALVTALAFVPVWLLVQAQRAIQLFADLLDPRR